MTHDEYILAQRIYCELCLEQFDFTEATHVEKEGRGQFLAVCDEHTKEFQPQLQEQL